MANHNFVPHGSVAVLRAEEQARLMEELKKYDGDYLGEDDLSGPENPEETGSGEKEKEGEDESNS